MNKPVVLREDDPDLRLLVRELLEEQDYAVYTVSEIDELLATCMKLAPCVALIDSTSPTEFDLWYLGPKLAAIGVPAIAFTAHSSALAQFAKDRSGYHGVISKPFDADEFIDLVNTICWEESREEAAS
jgi:DNA-binding NtrC family response regulator